ncbi:hypothetical protein PROFUN_11847 [Planoprotostelium fungivorum]|uniref:BTB domain-containing protein n=1 Tax=Planoprotostelium fungivorum TaxID=1890364 RepID=A0A2P6N9A6_9EUKA|nr:hypothetical protein PROFUN_11847 [Planoprotostelium fungivorum]
MIRMKACVSYESFLYSWIPTVTNAHLSLFDSKQKAPNLLVFYNSRARDTLGEENEGETFGRACTKSLGSSHLLTEEGKSPTRESVKQREVYSFGFNKMGALGLGNNEDSLEPSIIEGLKGKNIIKVRCGEQHSLAITEHGDLYAWGRGREGQLGQGDRNNSPIPLLVNALRHVKVIDVDSGSSHVVGLTETGRVYVWGRLYRLITNSDSWFKFAVEMPGLRKQQIIDRSVAQYLSGSGNELSEEEMMTSLNNNFGNFVPYNQTVPMYVGGILSKRKIINVSAGYAYTIAADDQGNVFSWGFNEKGQLGLGHRFNQENPQQVTQLDGVRIVKTACGMQHTAMLSDEGHLYTCGLGVFGQLGHGEPRDSLLPRVIETLSSAGEKIKDIALGSFFTMAISTNGKAWSWGHGEYGQHGGQENYQDWSTGGYGDEKDKNFYHSIPRPLMGMSNDQIQMLACGHLHSMALTQDHKILSWGWGSSGCLGHGNRRFQLVPKEVGQLQGEEIKSIAAGNKHSLVVTSSSVSTFAFDFAPLVNNTLYSDILLLVDGKEIPAHKCIVIARCERLRAAYRLQNRFSHKESDALSVKGVKYPIFMGLLRYLYTDHVKIPPHLKKDLGALAKRWGMERLYIMCKRGSATSELKSEGSVVIPPSSFSQEMSMSIDSLSMSPDITFIVQEEKIYGHRAILRARCPYFERLFESSFKERNERIFRVDETIKPEIFTSLLRYIYTNDEEVIREDNAIDLLRAADRFMVDDLKQTIEDYVENSIDQENVLWLLEVADRFGVPRLKRACVDYVCTQEMKAKRKGLMEEKGMIKCTKEYDDIKSTSPHLIRLIDEEMLSASA